MQGQGVMPDIEPSADRAGEAVDQAEREAEAEHGGAGRFALGAEARIEQVRRGREADRRRADDPQLEHVVVPRLGDELPDQSRLRFGHIDERGEQATDHAPHTWEEKQRPYAQAPSGLPLVQHALLAALELVHEGRLSNAQVVQKVCHAPAQLFDVAERGFLREGYAADLVLVDDAPLQVRREDVLSKCGWSPFEGMTFHSSIASTWVNGVQVWDGRRLQGAAAGQRLRYDR